MPPSTAVPPSTVTHVPSLPGTLQDSPSPVHAELQHTPSAQVSEAHWLDNEHGVPSGCGMGTAVSLRRATNQCAPEETLIMSSLPTWKPSAVSA